MRKTSGIAVHEIMEAYDWSANTIAKIYLRLKYPSEIRRLIDDLVAIHEYARQSIDEVNASSITPLDRPSGDVIQDRLVGGRLAAMLALAEGRYAELGSNAAADALAARELRTLLLRADISGKRDEQGGALLASLRDAAERQDDCDAECELAVLAQLRLENSAERLALADAYLPRAEACGLGMHWSDLQLARSHSLADLGRRDEARGAAEAALFGRAKMIGAYGNGDWAVAGEAVSLMRSIGVTVSEHVLADVERSVPPERSSPPKAEKRRADPSSGLGASAPGFKHELALRVIKAYQDEGTPFALYFRKFDIEVLHGPFELGPKLTENALRDALPPEVELITVQDHDFATKFFESSRFRREAPALLLQDKHWTEVVRALIPFADLIVSEPLMLSEGVRLELQMIYAAQRWDRTVLVLPPQNGPFPLIDKDSSIQMFPRCIWADALHQEPISKSPVVVDLLERIRAIVRLPVETRRTLIDPPARDKAYPVDLTSVAEYLETQAELGAVFNHEDETTRYSAFWQTFRAAAIRAVRYIGGDRSFDNCSKLVRSYIEMSKIMMDFSTEGDKFILQGDPAEAKVLIRSAYGLLQDFEDDLLVRLLRAEAETQWVHLVKLEQDLRDNANRFELRPRYGPLVLARAQAR
jgi:hypothetical protein